MERSSATCLPTAVHSLGSPLSHSVYHQSLPNSLSLPPLTHLSGHLVLLAPALLLCCPCPQPTDRYQGLALTQSCCHLPALSDFFFLPLISQRGKGGRKGGGGPWAGAVAPQLAGRPLCQGEEGGALVHPDR